MTLYIIGAGMAGLLAANMLRKHKPTVLEVAPSLPNNHSAVLRFGTSAVSDVLGIPFRRVSMIKDTLPWQNPVADAMAYAKKNLGRYESGRSIAKGAASAERWIAPDNLIEQMADGIPIKYGVKYDFKEGMPKVISTIPMPTLMTSMQYPRWNKVHFRYVNGVNVTATVAHCDAFVTLNVPSPGLPYSRVSVTGDKLIVEFPNVDLEGDVDFFRWAYDAAIQLGIIDSDLIDMKVHAQKYQKIGPIDEAERKQFVHWASAVKKVAWQVGRFATWRPGLQLDDLVKDIRLVERWMTDPGSSYDMERHLGS